MTKLLWSCTIRYVCWWILYFMIWNDLTLCNFVLQGSIFNTTTMSITCMTATDNLFDPNDTCSRAVEEFLNNNNSEIVNFLIDNCPTRLFEYVHDCNVNGEVSKQSMWLTFENKKFEDSADVYRNFKATTPIVYHSKINHKLNIVFK